MGVRPYQLIDFDTVELGREAARHTEMQVADRIGVHIRCIGEGATLEHELDLAADGSPSRVEPAPRYGILQCIHLVAGSRWCDG